MKIPKSYNITNFYKDKKQNNEFNYMKTSFGSDVFIKFYKIRG